MTSPVRIEMTPKSKRIVAEWSRDKKDKAEKIELEWLKRMGAWVSRETMKAFDDGRQPGGSPWPGNVGRYAEWKAGLGSSKPGVLNGALRRSFAHYSVDRGRHSAKIGSTLPYAGAIYYGKRGSWSGYVTGPGSATEFFSFSGIQPRPYFPAKRYGENHGAKLWGELVRYYCGR